MSLYPLSRAAELRRCFPPRRHNVARQEKCSFNPTATGDNHEHADSLSIARSWHSWSMVAGSRSECGHQYRQAATGHQLQRTPRSAATRHAFRRLFPAWFVRRPHQISAGDESHASLASRHGSYRLGHVRHVLFRCRRTMGREQTQGLSAGTLYSEPAKTPHFAWAKDGEVILQVTAIGPTGNTPIPQKQ